MSECAHHSKTKAHHSWCFFVCIDKRGFWEYKQGSPRWRPEGEIRMTQYSEVLRQYAKDLKGGGRREEAPAPILGLEDLAYKMAKRERDSGWWSLVEDPYKGFMSEAYGVDLLPEGLSENAIYNYLEACLRADAFPANEGQAFEEFRDFIASYRGRETFFVAQPATAEEVNGGIRDIIEALSLDQQAIVSALYGLGVPRRTVKEVATERGVSVSFIRQVQDKFLQKLRRNLKLGLTVNDLLAEIGRLREELGSALQLLQAEKKRVYRGSDEAFWVQLDRTVDSLRLSVRIRRALTAAGITTVGQLVQKSVEELMAIRGISDSSVKEIVACLRSLHADFKLGMVIPYR